MDYKYITFEKIKNIAKITLNRPDVLNSFNLEMGKELQNALKECESDDYRAVYLTGAGRAFCAGQDLSGVLEEKDLGKIVSELYNPIIKSIRHLPKPVVCAVNGVAAGAGVNIALACDIVFASDEASFIQSFSQIGLIPDSGGTYFLPRLIGLQRAASLMMLGEKILANKAKKMGMIYKSVESTYLHSTAWETTEKLAKMPTKGLAFTKELLNKSMANDLESQLALEKEFQRKSGNTDDYAEGIKAFIEKRKPKFKGK